MQVYFRLGKGKKYFPEFGTLSVIIGIFSLSHNNAPLRDTKNYIKQVATKARQIQ
jgi:hypothetical protein